MFWSEKIKKYGAKIRNDDKITSTILLVLFHFYFVVKVFIPKHWDADFTPRKKEK